MIGNGWRQEMNGDDRIWMMMTENEQWSQEMNGDDNMSDDRKWMVMTANEWWWQEMNGDDRKWMVIVEYGQWRQGNEWWWQEMNGDKWKWMVIIRNERWWQKMNDDNRKHRGETNYSRTKLISIFLTPTYIAGVPSRKKNNNHTIAYITLN